MEGPTPTSESSPPPETTPPPAEPTTEHAEPQDESRSERALRVSQLDADEMDNGLIHMLNAKISRALSVFGVSLKLLLLPRGG